VGDKLQMTRIALRDVELAPIPAAGEEHPKGIIGPGKRVTLHFALYLENGELVDSNFDKPPVNFMMGDGSLLPGFEQCLLGLGTDVLQEFMLAPEQAFGTVNEDNVQHFPRYRFPPDLALEQGLVIDFTDAGGNTQAGVVRSHDKNMVEVDFNHPLAGRAIRFRVHVHQVEEVQ